MKNYILIFFSIFFASHIKASSCSYDFNRDGRCDFYTVTPSTEIEGSSLVTISLNKTKNISGIFQTGSGGIAPGYFPGEMIIPLNFESPRDVQQSTYTFRWKDDLDNWVLTKESNWSEPYRDELYSLEKEDIPKEAMFPIDFQVKRIQCCILLSDFTEQPPHYKESDEHQQKTEIQKDIQRLKEILNSDNKGLLFYSAMPESTANRRPIPPDFIYELSTAITSENLETLNNYAYYMQKSGNNTLAIILLQKIHEKYPQRIVTKLNLADSYWQIDIKETACDFYKKYKASMLSTGKQKTYSETRIYKIKLQLNRSQIKAHVRKYR